MKRNLRLLIVDDSEDDAILLLRNVESNGFLVSHRRVDNAQALQGALADDTWDAAIVDYLIPGFSGLDALRQLKESNLDIPTLLVSGKLTEDQLVEALRNGAHDCLQKDQLVRLVPALDRELKEAAIRASQRHSLERIKQLNSMLVALREISKLIVNESDPNLLMQHACECLNKTDGYSSVWFAKYTDSAFTKLFQSGLSANSNRITKYLEAGSQLKCIKSALNNAGPQIISIVSAECSSCPVLSNDDDHGAICCRLEHGGSVYGVLSISLDRGRSVLDEEKVLINEICQDLAFTLHSIDQETQLRITEALYREQFENAPVPYINVTIDRSITRANKAASKFLGFPVQELIGMQITDIYHDDCKAKADALLLKLKQGESWSNEEMVYKRADGDVVYGLLSVKPIIGPAGHVIESRSVIIDITERVAAEEALRKSEERYRQLAEASRVIPWDASIASETFNFIGSYIELLLGYPLNSWYEPGAFVSRLHPDDRDAVLSKAREANQLLEPYSNEFRMIAQDGREVWLRNVVTIISNQGVPVRAIGHAFDITERKQAELSVAKSEQKLRTVIESSSDALIAINREGEITLFNPAAQELFGYAEDEMLGRRPSLLIADRLGDLHTEFVNSYFITGKPNHAIGKTLELTATRKSGEQFPIELSLSADNRRDSEMMLAVIRDITDRKRAHDALLESEERFRTIAEHGFDGIYIHKDFKLLFTNQQFADMIGKDRDSIVGSSVIDLFTPSSRETIRGYINSNSEGHILLELIHSDGSVKFVQSIGQACVYHGKEARIVAITDVTQRFEYEQALAAEAMRRRTLVDRSRDGIVVLDEFGNVFETNQRFAEMLGYTLDELYQLHIWDWDAKWTREELLNILSVVDERGEMIETQHRKKNGMIIDVEISSNSVSIAGTILIFCVCRDVTDRNIAALALRQEMEKAQHYLDIAGVIFIGLDTVGHITLVNRRACQVLGYQEDEMLGKLWFEHFLPPSDAEPIRQIHNSIIAGQVEEYARVEGPVITASGDIRQITWINSVIRDSEGRVAGTLSSGEDVSEIRQAEAGRRLAEQRYNQLSKASLDGVVTTDEQGLILDCNQAYVDMVGYSLEELRTMTSFDLTPEQWHSLDQHYLFKQALDHDYCDIYEKEYVHKNGNILPIEVSSYSMWDDSGHFQSIWSIVRDISERKKAETELRSALQVSKNREMEIEALLSGARAVLQQGSFTDSAAVIHQSCKKVIGADGGYIALLNEEGDENDVLYLDPGSQVCTVDPDLPMPIRGLREKAYRTGEAVYDNGFADSDHIKLLPEGHASLENVLFAPLMIGGTARGMLGLANKPGGFTNHDTEIAVAFSEIATIGLLNTRATEALHNSQKLLQLALEGTDQGIWDWDMTGTKVYFDEHWCAMLGYEISDLEPDFSTWQNLLHADDKQNAEAVVGSYLDQLSPDSDVIYETSFRMRCKDGRYKWILSRGKVVSFDNQGNPTRFTGTHADITAKRMAEDQLKQAHQDLMEAHEQLKSHQQQLVISEKMASLGQLAAGVAHEINNPIAFIKSNLGTLESYFQVIKEHLMLNRKLVELVTAADTVGAQSIVQEIKNLQEQEDILYIIKDIDDLINESEAGSNRVRDIVQDLRNYAHAGQEEASKANVNDIIESSLRIAWNELKYKCEVTKELMPLPDITCYPDRLSQVFVNMLINASQAIQHDKGDIIIVSELCGEYIKVSFIDNGEGIPPEIIGRLFDPFFTTKEVGQGTGLGLSISHRTIEKHNGWIDVESDPGKGSTFVINLPVSNK